MTPPQQDVDELFDVKNYFYIGNYQQCINEAQKIKKPSSAEVAIDRDVFTYRAYIAQNKYLVVIDEISSSSHPKVQSLKLLAEYLSAKTAQQKDAVLAQLEQKMAAGVREDNDVLVIVAATIYMNEKQMETAFKVLHTVETLETMAMSLHILLKIDRVDLARKKLKEMQDKDDDATLTQLVQAWINVAMGGDKLQDAYYIYQELVDKYGSTSLLLNAQAACFLSQGKYEETDSALHEALDKDPNYPETLINLAVLSMHNRRDFEVMNRYFSQLKDTHPNHQFLSELKQKENEFSQIIQQYAPSKQ